MLTSPPTLTRVRLGLVSMYIYVVSQTLELCLIHKADVRYKISTSISIGFSQQSGLWIANPNLTLARVRLEARARVRLRLNFGPPAYKHKPPSMFRSMIVSYVCCLV